MSEAFASDATHRCEAGGIARARAAAAPAPLRPLLRWLLLGTGWLSVGLGGIGIVLPLLPTTPFLLLAATCFARASPRFYDWLLGTRVLGQYIRDYRARLGVPLRVKAIALSTLWITILGSIFWLVPPWPVRALLFLIASAVSLHLLRLPTRRRDRPSNQQ
ncbi:MAG TPA: YbaN family protein [Woeseiaceae bacterium]|nr:YbaN family protein [Woeseiaceae bacterium]